MSFRSLQKVSLSLACCLSVALAMDSAAMGFQIQEVQAAEAAQKLPPAAESPFPAVDPAATKPAAEEADDEPVVDTNANQEIPKIGDQWAQLHLQDGSIIGGEIKVKSIDVKTAYGMLTIPIARIVQIYPGLNSSDDLNQKISKLVEDLGGPQASDRDAAQKQLTAMGPKIRQVLRQLGDGGSAERKKRLNEIHTSLDETIEEAMDEFLELERQMIFDDTIVTPDFSIVGEIQQKEFAVTSKFGPLKVRLGDIKLADRKIKQGRQQLRKSVAVPAMAFFQKKPQSTGIRVNRGDKISIRADGVVQWTNWSASSTPAGLTNRSQWNGINSGKLAARIGSDNSRCVQIGAKGEFVAKSNGVLYLGIAMRDSYASNAGYTWTGEYQAKITVDPK